MELEPWNTSEQRRKTVFLFFLLYLVLKVPQASKVCKISILFSAPTYQHCLLDEFRAAGAHGLSILCPQSMGIPCQSRWRLHYLIAYTA